MDHNVMWLSLGTPSLELLWAIYPNETLFLGARLLLKPFEASGDVSHLATLGLPFPGMLPGLEGSPRLLPSIARIKAAKSMTWPLISGGQ
jgi:hypothetical protein